MTSLFRPHSVDHSSASLPEETGLARLWQDVAHPEEEAGLPSELLERLFERIDAEPARVETDAEGRVVAINPAFTRLCGYTYSELSGRKPGRVLQGADSDPQAIARLREAVRAGQGCVVDLINYHKDGSAYRVKIELEPIRRRDYSLQGFRATETKLPLA